MSLDEIDVYLLIIACSFSGVVNTTLATFGSMTSPSAAGTLVPLDGGGFLSAVGAPFLVPMR